MAMLLPMQPVERQASVITDRAFPIPIPAVILGRVGSASSQLLLIQGTIHLTSSPIAPAPHGPS
ncbi:MAG: hypothetical protein Fur0025_11540 [Oscillatoriaceae cyanobacterium]